MLFPNRNIHMVGPTYLFSILVHSFSFVPFFLWHIHMQESRASSLARGRLREHCHRLAPWGGGLPWGTSVRACSPARGSARVLLDEGSARGSADAGEFLVSDGPGELLDEPAAHGSTDVVPRAPLPLKAVCPCLTIPNPAASPPTRHASCRFDPSAGTAARRRGSVRLANVDWPTSVADRSCRRRFRTAAADSATVAADLARRHLQRC
jgi:hypothetical protein